MYDWQEELNKEAKAQKKRWDGKVITTSKQWENNDSGSRAVSAYSFDKIFDAVKDYQNSRSWC